MTNSIRVPLNSTDRNYSRRLSSMGLLNHLNNLSEGTEIVELYTRDADWQDFPQEVMPVSKIKDRINGLGFGKLMEPVICKLSDEELQNKVLESQQEGFITDFAEDLRRYFIEIIRSKNFTPVIADESKYGKIAERVAAKLCVKVETIGVQNQ